MIVAVLIVTLGLSIGGYLAHSRGLRLSGVVVLSLVAVYTLVNVVTLPIFVLSAILAYLGVQLIQSRWLLYGRPLLLAAILIGAVLPVGSLLTFGVVAGEGTTATEVTFLGSILPGIAAYNVHRQDPERRTRDVLASVGVFVTLLAVGVATLVAWARPPCWSCSVLGVAPAAYVTPILLHGGTDVVALLDLAANGSPPRLGTVGSVTAVVVVGLGLGEAIRSRWGLRPLGVIALPVVALFALRAWWLVVLYGVALGVTYAVTQFVHDLTLLYGRTLLSIATGIGLAGSLAVLVAFDLPFGFSVFFAGLLAGIGAYNLHVVAPQNRLATLIVSGGYFVIVFGFARLLVSPLEAGLARRVVPEHLLVGGVVLGATAWTIYRLESRLPTTRSIRDASRLRKEVGDE